MRTISLIGEGFEAALAPCTLVLILGGFAAGFVSKEHAVRAIGSFWVAALLMGWARFANHLGDVHPLLLASLLVVAVGLWFWPPIDRNDWTATVAASLTGIACAGVWLPCVGEAFGQVLAELPHRGLSGVWYLALYLGAALSPVIGFAALHHLLSDHVLERVEPVWAAVAGTAVVLFAFALAFGFHEDVLGQLLRWSV